MWSTRQERNHWVQLHGLLLILTILGFHYSFATHTLTFLTDTGQPIYTGPQSALSTIR